MSGPEPQSGAQAAHRTRYLADVGQSLRGAVGQA